MDQRTCSIEGCERSHQARGFCSSHYGTWHRQQHGRKRYSKTCAACGEVWHTYSTVSRYCSQFCQIYDRLGPQACAWKPPKPVRVKLPPFRENRDCLWCGEGFVALRASHVYCSADHKVRAKRVRRRGREYGWTSNFTWSEVMRVWRKFDRRCAYCDEAIVGLPDPDHVVPLSRGGCNSITNILPCCSACNSDKRDLLLTEWNADRERRGLPARRVAWSESDARVTHLTVLTAAA